MMKRILIFSLMMASGAKAERPMRGIYRVPVKDTSLQEAAVFDIKFHSDSYDDPRTLEFPLPIELTGREIQVKFQRDNNGIFVGPNGSGECSYEGRYYNCTMKFQNLAFDEVAAKVQIDQKYSSAEAQKKLAVFVAFSGEPIGILSYKMRGRDRGHGRGGRDH